MKLILLALALVLAACAVQPEPDTDTTEQELCRVDPDTCINWPQHCIPLSQCTDSDVRSGFSCPAFKKLPTHTTVGQVICGNNLEGLPTCHSHNVYDFGLVKVTCTTVTCTTVTEWFGDGQGGITVVTSTECTTS